MAADAGCAEPPWFAVQVRQRYETLVLSILENKGFNPFLPLRKVRRVRSDRTVEMEVPLFPGYLFCRLDMNGRILPVLTTPGVVRLVGAGRVPVAVEEDEIRAVRTIVDSGLAAESWPVPRVGEQVRVLAGPLRGLEGVLVAAKKHHRLVVTISLLNRAVAVEIDADCAGLVQETRRPPVGEVSFPGKQTALRTRAAAC